MPKVPAQAIAIVAGDAAELRRQQALELPGLSRAAALLGGRAARGRRRGGLPSRRRSAAAAETPGSHDGRDPNALTRPASPTAPPPGHRAHGARRCSRIAEPAARDRARARRKHRGLHARRRSPRARGRWQVSYFARPRRPGRRSRRCTSTTAPGAVLEAWTGFQVAWTMARGYAGAFGRKVNALVRLAPAVRAVPGCRSSTGGARSGCCTSTCSCCSASRSRSPSSTTREIGLSVPLVYPLAGLPARAHADRSRAARRRGRASRCSLLVPVTWLAVALVFLVGFRVGLNVAELERDRRRLRGRDRRRPDRRRQAALRHFPNDNEHGDTYGPVNYYAYVPFEQILPWSGTLGRPAGRARGGDRLRPPHAARLLFLLGRRMPRARRSGSCSPTPGRPTRSRSSRSNSNSNDALVALLLRSRCSWSRCGAARAARRSALAGLTKFAPLALAPLFATAGPRRRRLRVGRAASRCSPWRSRVTAAVVMLPVLLRRRPARRSTTARSASRPRASSPFSIWGLYGLDSGAERRAGRARWCSRVAVAFVPRRRDLVRLAALGGGGR